MVLRFGCCWMIKSGFQDLSVVECKRGFGVDDLGAIMVGNTIPSPNIEKNLRDCWRCSYSISFECSKF